MPVTGRRRTSKARRRATALVCSLVGAVGIGWGATSSASGAAVFCDVNGAGGFVACLSQYHSYQEVGKAYHASGLPYKYRLLNHNNTSQIFGTWQWSNYDFHVVGVFFSCGVMRASIDNLGSGSPSRYYVELVQHPSTCV